MCATVVKPTIVKAAFLYLAALSPKSIGSHFESTNKNVPELNITWPLDGSILLNRAFALR